MNAHSWRNRKIFADPHVEFDTFYYANHRNEMRIVNLKRKVISKCDWDNFPYEKILRRLK